ncbi:MAG: hypothetical protein II339_00255, partial [Spirochaetales bacterium]|nr:hypothetical protein [Spirochaetales bacterium]
LYSGDTEGAGKLYPMLKKMLSNCDNMMSDRGLFAIHAVRYLCKSMKDRSSDEMYNWIMKEYKAGNIKPEIPEYAIDKHTLQGQIEGKDEDYFYSTGSVVEPEWEGRDRTYRERILTILEENKRK